MEFTTKCRELYEAHKMRKFYEQLEEKLKDELKEICENEPRSEDGFCFSYTLRQGTIDYKSIPVIRAMGVELEQYRKEPQKAWSLKLELV